MEEQDTNTANPVNSSLSTLVTYCFFLIGLISEGIAIISIINSKIGNVGNTYSSMIFLCIILMLMHQFFIFRNFHKIDHSHDTEFGKWISESKSEDILRVIIFISFAGLAGEFIYLMIVNTKNFNSAAAIHCVDNPTLSLYDLSWMTGAYLFFAIFMYSIMVVYDIVAIGYDYSTLSKINFQKLSYTDNIVSFPLNHAYYTFIISDIVGLSYWVTIYGLVYWSWDFHLLAFFFILYLLVIGSRIYGEWKVNKPKIINRWNVWRCKSW